MKEMRIYVDGKLVNICQNEYASMCNLMNYKQKYGKKVTTKIIEICMDKEKRDWLDTI